MAGRPNVGCLGHGRHIFGSPAARWLPGQDLTLRRWRWFCACASIYVYVEGKEKRDRRREQREDSFRQP
jgi:hypothetical protein